MSNLLREVLLDGRDETRYGVLLRRHVHPEPPLLRRFRRDGTDARNARLPEELCRPRLEGIAQVVDRRGRGEGDDIDLPRFEEGRQAFEERARRGARLVDRDYVDLAARLS